MIRFSIGEVANQALLDRSEYYLEQSGLELSERCESAVFTTLRRLQQFPESGARYASRAPRLRGLRFTPIDGFPYHLLFYFYDSELEAIRIIHILHGARDIGLELDQIV